MSENEKIMKLLEEIRDRLPAPAMRPVPLQQPWYPYYPSYPVYPWYPTPWWGTYPGNITYGATTTITGSGATTTYAVNL